MKIVRIVVVTLIGLGLSHAQAPFPDQAQLISLLRHGIRWRYRWQNEARDQPVVRRLTERARLRGRSLLMDGPEGRQVWSFVPGLRMHVAFVASPSNPQWKLLRIEQGPPYSGEIDTVVQAYLDFYYQSRDNAGCAPELLPQVTKPTGQRAPKQNPGTTLPLARPCPPRESVSWKTVDFELTVGSVTQLETDSQCQRESAGITRQWIAEHRRSMNGRFVVPACSSLDPLVYVLLEPIAGEANILIVSRDVDGQFVPWKAIERQETVRAVAKLIGSTSSLSFAVPK